MLFGRKVRENERQRLEYLENAESLIGTYRPLVGEKVGIKLEEAPVKDLISFPRDFVRYNIEIERKKLQEELSEKGMDPSIVPQKALFEGLAVLRMRLKFMKILYSEPFLEMCGSVYSRPLLSTHYLDTRPSTREKVIGDISGIERLAVRSLAQQAWDLLGGNNSPHAVPIVSQMFKSSFVAYLEHILMADTYSNKQLPAKPLIGTPRNHAGLVESLVEKHGDNFLRTFPSQWQEFMGKPVFGEEAQKVWDEMKDHVKDNEEE